MLHRLQITECAIAVDKSALRIWTWIDGFTIRAGCNPKTAVFLIREIERQPGFDGGVRIGCDVIQILMPALPAMFW